MIADRDAVLRRGSESQMGGIISWKLALSASALGVICLGVWFFATGQSSKWRLDEAVGFTIFTAMSVFAVTFVIYEFGTSALRWLGSVLRRAFKSWVSWLHDN